MVSIDHYVLSVLKTYLFTILKVCPKLNVYVLFLHTLGPEIINFTFQANDYVVKVLSYFGQQTRYEILNSGIRTDSVRYKC